MQMKKLRRQEIGRENLPITFKKKQLKHLNKRITADKAKRNNPTIVMDCWRAWQQGYFGDRKKKTLRVSALRENHFGKFS